MDLLHKNRKNRKSGGKRINTEEPAIEMANPLYKWGVTQITQVFVGDFLHTDTGS